MLCAALSRIPITPPPPQSTTCPSLKKRHHFLCRSSLSIVFSIAALLGGQGFFTNLFCLPLNTHTRARMHCLFYPHQNSPPQKKRAGVRACARVCVSDGTRSMQQQQQQRLAKQKAHEGGLRAQLIDPPPPPTHTHAPRGSFFPHSPTGFSRLSFCFCPVLTASFSVVEGSQTKQQQNNERRQGGARRQRAACPPCARAHTQLTQSTWEVREGRERECSGG